MGDLGQRHCLDRVVDDMAVLLDEAHGASLIGLDQEGTAQALKALTVMGSRLAELTAAVTRHAEEVQVGELGGSTSTAVWLGVETRIGRQAGFRQARLAEALGRWERVNEALCSGIANPEQVSVICHALDSLPDDLDPDLVRRCEIHLVGLVDQFGPRELRALGRHVLTVLAPEVGEAHEAKQLEDEERRAAETTLLSMTRDGHGLVRGRFTIPELHAAMLTKHLQSLTWNDDDPHRRARPSDARKGQALCELLERISDVHLPDVGGTGATVVVTMRLETLVGGLAEAVLDNGDRISAATARRMACQARIIPVVLGGKSAVLDLGRRRRLHTRAQRIAIAVRDRHCTADGCDAPPSLCHVHHDTPWAAGGNTTVDEGRLLCPRHHRAIHDPAQTVRLRT